MPEPIPSCFRGGVAGGPPASTAVGPSLTTSIYDTHLGLASFSWSRTVLGLSLRADLRLSPSSSLDDEDDDNGDDPFFFFRIRPWFFWKRKGTRRFQFQNSLPHRTVDVAWDLTRARFPSAGGPEPNADFFVAVAVDGEMLLVAGDMEEEAHRKMKARRGAPAPSISRREHVLLKPDAGAGGRRSYRTAARVSGKEREIWIEIGGKEKETSGMCVSVDGMKVLQVKRLRWKFRGRERVEIDGDGGRIQISWDLHNWLFPSKEDATPTSVAGEIGQAVFIFRFEREEAEKREEVSCVQKEKGLILGKNRGGGGGGGGGGGLYRDLILGYLGKNREWSERSSSGMGQRVKAKKKSLLKTSSSSSSSSASSAGSSSVMDWASPEEAELRGVDGFSLVVYAWKS